MTVGDLLREAPLREGIPPSLAAQSVAGLAYDSRCVEPGWLFFAFPGSKADGRAFAAAAMQAGAVAVVSESTRPDGFSGHWIEVEHGRQALAVAAGTFFGHPDRRLKLTGITGTNGKTTTAYLLDSIWQAAGRTTALIGTIEHRVAGDRIPSINTTPESLDLFQLFAKLEQLGGTAVTMEVSSHALELRRVYAIQFDTAIFTNLTRDHLDFHGSMDKYFAAKQLLFTGTGSGPPRVAVINSDDPVSAQIPLSSRTEVVRYGFGEHADARAHALATSLKGLKFKIGFRGWEYRISSELAGTVNAYNILAAWSAAFSAGIDPEEIAQGILACKGVPGRFERVDEGQPFLLVVDYAHTDDALRNTIAIARNLTTKRVITLFGCGGDRDRTKRPLMGMAAAEGSDLVVLTSDNPRSEDPISIMNDALVGLRRSDTPLIIEPDRERAIRKAIEAAGAGDVLILAGKGHENYQVLKNQTIHFDDREVAISVLRGFGFAKKEAGKA